MSVDNGVVYLMDPPSGMIRDVNQRAEYEPLVVVSAVFFPLSTIAMAVRLYTRVAIVHKLSLDDYLMILAWTCNVLLVAFTLNMTNYGMGKHLWNVPATPDIYPNFSLNNLLAAIFFCAATGLAKGSILLFYLRIFPMKKAQILVWVAFVFIVGYSTASVLVNIFSCHPVQGSWDLEYVPTAKCVNRPVFYFLQAGLGIFADIMTVIIPIPWLKTLMLPKRQKIGVGILLTMGAS
ncbi:integral membrane protein [Fusarium heterosporum]|uniref:Integral membrane protein n=1 Tax=Fusarium heterosporum TaxID=42747 RepID=A0A8H5TMT7_FUSHE|nr:integral membrane protein [Fusarium heterosporum]